MKPFFSIIIPYHQINDLLYKSINSILDQNFYNFELILVGDGIKDEIKLYNINCKIKNITLKKSYGAGKARQIGVDHSVGEYLIFLDSDDEIFDNKCLISLYRSLIDSPDLLMYEYRYGKQNSKAYINCSDNELSFWSKVKRNSAKEISLRNYPEILLFPAYPWNKVYKRRFVIENQITFSETKCHNDLKFSWHSTIAAKRIVVLSQIIVLHDIDEFKPRITNNRSINRMDLFQAFKETEKILNNYDVSDIIISYYQKFKWDAFNWGKFRIMEEGIWPFIKKYHKQLLRTHLKEKWFFLNEHAISNLERIKFLMICYIPFVYYFLFKINLKNNEY